MLELCWVCFFKLAFVFFAMSPSFFEHFLTFWCTENLRFIGYFPCSSPAISDFFKEPRSF